MRWACLTLFLSFALLIPVHGGEGNIRPRFELAGRIDGTFKQGHQGRLVVADEVFGEARTFPNDLRIISSNGTQWPFFLHVTNEKTDTKTITLDIINRSWVSEPEPFLQFDLVVPVVDGHPPVHNQLELVTSGGNYVRRVEISSGDPERPAGHMASGYLIDFSSQRDARNRIIRYPDSDVERLHVRVYPNAQAADEVFSINSVHLLRNVAVDGEREPVGFDELEVGERDSVKNAQTHILDIGVSDRPVEFISFDVSDTSYARCVAVYGRNDDHEPWQWVGGGEIHALPGDCVDTVKLRAHHRFLEVQVFHYDDQPLAISSIRLEAIPRYLVFEAATDGPADLYFRAWDINAPRYDLQGRIKKESIATLPVYQTLDAMPNQAAKAQPWRKYSKFLGGLAVAAVSLMVVWIIVSMLRQATPEDPS